MSKVGALKEAIRQLDSGEPMEAMFEDGCRLMNEEERQDMRNGLIRTLQNQNNEED